MNRIRSMLSLLLCVCILLSLLTLTASAESGFVYKKGANTVSESYKKSEFYEKLIQIELTGDGRQDVLAVALSQLGYQESGVVNDFSGNPGGASSNYTEYNYSMGDFGVGYGGGSYAWCASFVSWCLLQSGCTTQNSLSDWCRSHKGDKNYIWREVGCPTWAQQLRTCGYWQEPRQYGGNYTPVGGDLIFFTWDGTKYSEDHIGIVVYCDGSTVYTVEGNTADAAGLETNGAGVYFKSYSVNSTYIAGYGVLPYKTTNDPKVDHSGKEPTAGLYITERQKVLYLSADSNTPYKRIPRFSLVRVIRPASNGRLRVVCTIKGKTYKGYIDDKPNERVLPLNYYDSTPRGDVNFDGEVTQYDYILIKRACMQTFAFNDEQNDRADVNEDGEMNSYDYILVKRHCMETFDIGE